MSRLGRILLLLGLGLGVFHVDLAFGQRNSENRLEKEHELGMLFVNGKHLPPPYVISVDGESVRVNGSVYPIPADEYLAEEGWSRSDGSARFVSQRELEGRRPRTSNAQRWAFGLCDALDNDALVVAFDQVEPVVLYDTISQGVFCTAALAEPPSVKQLDEVTAFAPNDRERWVQWLMSFQPEPALSTWLTQRASKFRLAQDANERQIRAFERLELATYPLNMMAMLLGVIGLGHSLRWHTHLLPAAESLKGMKVALTLIVGMSAIDLVWTILSIQAGKMTEMNPIAAQFVGTPSGLALFKLTATGTACLALYWKREHPRIQLATWWMCLVCVLLTFRWIVVDSAM
ncbi:MAG: hypothetical protein KDB03_16870 [Planctomycetales bacterium]|nr:hypothetical protein [Planctomycetales bacterium]